jgi:V/A-type H+-transporting ATPase subunit I
MLRAARLSKVMIIGPKSEWKPTIERLHSLKLLHVDEFVDSVGGMSIGEPLEGTDKLSRQLVKTRRTMSLLDLSHEGVPPGRVSLEEAQEFVSSELAGVEKAATDLVKKREELAAKVEDIEGLKVALQPLARFPKGTRFDLESVEAVAGRCKKDLSQTLERISPTVRIEHVKMKKHHLLLVYYPEDVGEKVRDILDLAKFEYFDIPDFKGNVHDRLKKVEGELELGRKTLKEVETALARLMDEKAGLLLAAEEYLADEVEKAELPLLCATTDNLFTIEGWVKKADAQRLRDGLEKPLGGRVTVQVLDDSEVDEESPVLLRHTKPVRPFKYLIDMYSTPNFKEIDPTLILAIIFPLFFGLMIGDLGYGIILVIMGLILKRRSVFGIGGNAVGNIIILGGIAAIIFGSLLFGDMFGVPFHAHGGEMDWASFGVHIPYHAPVGKLDAHSVITLLVLSVTAGFLHMGLGLIFGLVNSARHKDLRHVASRVGWLLLLVGIYLLAMNLAQDTELGRWICRHLLFDLQANSVLLSGIEVPWLTVYLLIPGLLILICTEGGFAIIESLGMLTNIISYTRLAAVGVAKAALALAINSIFIDMVFPIGLHGMVLGIVFIAVGQFFIVVLLGTLSAGIQAIRLNYVEFFMKFYEGNGRAFKPFGATNRYAVRKGVGNAN